MMSEEQFDYLFFFNLRNFCIRTYALQNTCTFFLRLHYTFFHVRYIFIGSKDKVKEGKKVLKLAYWIWLFYTYLCGVVTRFYLFKNSPGQIGRLIILRYYQDVCRSDTSFHCFRSHRGVFFFFLNISILHLVVIQIGFEEILVSNQKLKPNNNTRDFYNYISNRYVSSDQSQLRFLSFLFCSV